MRAALQAALADPDAGAFRSIEIRKLWRQSLGIRRYARSLRAIAAHSRRQLFEERSRRTLEEPGGRFRIVSRKDKVELIASMGFFMNGEENSPRR